MAEVLDTAPVPSRLGLLFRIKVRSLNNRVRQAVTEAPVRVGAAVVLVAIIWIGLYFLFSITFRQFRRTPLEATVAIPLIFNFFFVAMLALLSFSNAIISYGALFGKNESAYLLAAPLTARDVVTLKYLESLTFASWSLIVLGLPLMLAMAQAAEEQSNLAAPLIFYMLFVAFFLAFIPIPAALGLLAAWVSARFFPRKAVRVVAVLVGLVLAVLIVWGMRSLRLGDSVPEIWLRSFLARMSFVEATFLPNNWVARGIDNAIHGQFAEAALYLGVTVANALFASWLAVLTVARYFSVAHDRASAGRREAGRAAVQPSGGVAGLVFFYLPLPLRLIAAKDLRTFFRDPLQWSQLVILFGLIVLYLTNMPTLRLRVAGSGWLLIIPFLNLCAVSLILATFTCRFVFPLVSLEGQELWLVGLLPMRRGRILLAKLAFALTVTLLVAVGTMSLAAFMLELDLVWAGMHLLITIAVCFGLCGFAVGIGARLPMFNQPNAARIANGLGGTTNLLASVALVAIVMFGVGYATWRCRDMVTGEMPEPVAGLICLAVSVFAIAAGGIALHVGARHFDRVEV
ncbi:MAG: hypothetical protein PVI86_09580 [Phycisphaerae bacterium]|jgi:ABC-2 type transport system permease protein